MASTAPSWLNMHALVVSTKLADSATTGHRPQGGRPREHEIVGLSASVPEICGPSLPADGENWWTAIVDDDLCSCSALSDGQPPSLCDFCNEFTNELVGDYMGELMHHCHDDRHGLPGHRHCHDPNHILHKGGCACGTRGCAGANKKGPREPCACPEAVKLPPCDFIENSAELVGDYMGETLHHCHDDRHGLPGHRHCHDPNHILQEVNCAQAVEFLGSGGGKTAGTGGSASSRPAKRSKRGAKGKGGAAVGGRGVQVCEWPGCGKEFKTKYKMQRHYNTVHMKKKDFTCTVCGKVCSPPVCQCACACSCASRLFVFSSPSPRPARSFSTSDPTTAAATSAAAPAFLRVQAFGEKGNLALHMRTVHEQVKAALARRPRCPSRAALPCIEVLLPPHFPSPPSLLSCSRPILDGVWQDKRHKCPHCDASFGQGHTLKTHIESVHLGKLPSLPSPSPSLPPPLLPSPFLPFAAALILGTVGAARKVCAHSSARSAADSSRRTAICRCPSSPALSMLVGHRSLTVPCAAAAHAIQARQRQGEQPGGASSSIFGLQN